MHHFYLNSRVNRSNTIIKCHQSSLLLSQNQLKLETQLFNCLPCRTETDNHTTFVHISSFSEQFFGFLFFLGLDAPFFFDDASQYLTSDSLHALLHQWCKLLPNHLFTASNIKNKLKEMEDIPLIHNLLSSQPRISCTNI